MDYEIDIKSTTERTYCVDAENEKNAQDKALGLMYEDEEVSEAWKDGAEIVCPASARLIAAAPELYEQCKLFEKCLTYLINSGDSGADLERDNLRAILDKVDGGEG